MTYTNKLIWIMWFCKAMDLLLYNYCTWDIGGAVCFPPIMRSMRLIVFNTRSWIHSLSRWTRYVSGWWRRTLGRRITWADVWVIPGEKLHCWQSISLKITVIFHVTAVELPKCITSTPLMLQESEMCEVSGLKPILSSKSRHMSISIKSFRLGR